MDVSRLCISIVVIVGLTSLECSGQQTTNGEDNQSCPLHSLHQMHDNTGNKMDLILQLLNTTIQQQTSTIQELNSTIQRLNTDIQQHVMKVFKDSKDCSEIWAHGVELDGVYTIRVQLNGTYKYKKVYCKFRDDGGWTLLQHRKDGSINFYKKWTDYKNGFGKVSEEFWLGNDLIYQLTNTKSYTLRVELKKFNGDSCHAEFDSFRIDDESQNYKLHVSGYSGTCGDSLTAQNNMRFTTPDRDNDICACQCGVLRHGAWWYDNCAYSNLNAEYWHSGKCRYSATSKCIYSYHFGNSYNTPFRQTSMMIKDATIRRGSD